MTLPTSPARWAIGSALLASCLLGVDVRGYTSSGHNWGTNQVVYYVNPQSVTLSPSAVTSAIQTAAAGWSQQSDANIQLVYGGTTNGSSLGLNNKNEIFLRNDTSGYVGETYWWYDVTGHLVDADIVFHEGSYQFYAFSGCSNGVYLENVAIHEIGHALGLRHSSTPGATMSASMTAYCDTSQNTLEADDIAGIESLYPPTSGGQAPAAPAQLTVALSASSPTSALTLAWQDNANNETGYRVERSADGSAFAQIASLGGNSQAYTNTGLAAGTAYSYRVVAYNNNGTSGYSNSATGQTQAVPTNSAPVVSIATPYASSQYPAGTSISFSGAATDAQEGTISSRLIWNSNIDGQIGNGPSFSRALSAGTHNITAKASDAAGLQGTALVTVNVASAVAPPPGGTPSPDGTRGATIVDASLAVWTFGAAVNGGFATLRNGSHVGGGGAVEYLWLGGKVYVRNSYGSWYEFNGTGWTSSENPTATAPPPPPPPPPSGLTASVRPFKVKGSQQVDVSWSGFVSSAVDIYRNGVKVTTTANDGAYTDPISAKGGGSYSYKVCEGATQLCASPVTASF